MHHAVDWLPTLLSAAASAVVERVVPAKTNELETALCSRGTWGRGCGVVVYVRRSVLSGQPEPQTTCREPKYAANLNHK